MPELPGWFWYVVVFVYGSMVGSFLNVLIYRMPLGISVAAPPSHCPRCRNYLGLWDNIPLLSFLVLRARCRFCRAPISWRYFLVELLNAALWVCLFHRLSGETGVSWADFLFSALFASVLVAVIFIDLDHFFIPDELNSAAAGLALARDAICLLLARQAGYWDETARRFLYAGWLPRALVGALVYGGILFLISFLTFLYYAREEGESAARTARRFFVYEEPEPQEPPADGEDTEPEPPGEEETADEEAMNEEGEPVRLRFSPAVLAAASALLLAPALGVWWKAALVFALILAAFVVLSPPSEEASALSRFFRASEAAAPEEDETEEAADSDSAQGRLRTSTLAAEADQFAREAETGKHGGMGLGDAKLALAIGALLGPGQALLSLFFATAAGAITGIALARVHGRSLRVGIPFGPFMALGAILALLYGPALWEWYLRTMGMIR